MSKPILEAPGKSILKEGKKTDNGKSFLCQHPRLARGIGRTTLRLGKSLASKFDF